MGSERKTNAIIRARKTVAKSLVAALRSLSSAHSEKELADRWQREICKRDELLPFGWYQPPPVGMSVLIANPPSYKRLIYNSLREELNWPSNSIIRTTESVLYPYFSAIDRRTGMIGDYVATFYGGTKTTIRDWMREVYCATLKVADFAKVGVSFREIFDFAEGLMKAIGASNNTYSLSGGTASDIGHTIPWFCDSNAAQLASQFDRLPQEEVARRIAGERKFLNHNNDTPIGECCAFTIEPQMLVSNLPMASFHMIVTFEGGEKTIIQEFGETFEYFGMSQWINSNRKK